MLWITALVGLIIGFIAAANMLVDRKANTTIHTGIIGLIGFVLGVATMLKIVLSQLAILPMVHANLLSMLGALLALDIIKSLVKTEQMDNLVAKLTPFKGVLGLVLMGLSLYLMLQYFKAS